MWLCGKTKNNFILGHNFWTVRDGDFIFGMNTQLIKPFQMTTRSMTLWPWLTVTLKLKIANFGLGCCRGHSCFTNTPVFILFSVVIIPMSRGMLKLQSVQMFFMLIDWKFNAISNIFCIQCYVCYVFYIMHVMFSLFCYVSLCVQCYVCYVVFTMSVIISLLSVSVMSPFSF